MFIATGNLLEDSTLSHASAKPGPQSFHRPAQWPSNATPRFHRSLQKQGQRSLPCSPGPSHYYLGASIDAGKKKSTRHSTHQVESGMIGYWKVNWNTSARQGCAHTHKHTRQFRRVLHPALFLPWWALTVLSFVFVFFLNKFNLISDTGKTNLKAI